jgi:PEP-CTERM motif-containing protein
VGFFFALVSVNEILTSATRAGKRGIYMSSIRKFLTACAITAIPAALAFTATPALATRPVGAGPDANPPTLHGFCSVANACPDNGTNSPTSVNPPVFGFATSGQSDSGTLYIAILTPDDLAPPGSFTFTGYLTGTASLVSSTPWTTGQLDNYLGLPQGPPPEVSPVNPIGAFLPTTQGYDPTADGFYVFWAAISGTTTLPGTSGTGDSYLSTLGQNLAAGSYILAFLQQDDDYGATANSGAILETDGHPPVPEPSTWAMMVLGFGAAGVAVRRSRKKAPVSQLA